jgi:hypothetical protein
MSSEMPFAGEARGAASWCHCSATVWARILREDNLVAYLLLGRWVGSSTYCGNYWAGFESGDGEDGGRGGTC